ncbi:MAG: hypothetical protein AAB925_00130 [Patescibacteria group bacterium]
MKQESNKKIILGLLLSGFLSARSVAAQVCPVCVVAIGAGLGFSRWLGIDDVIFSVWIGAFMFAIISWTLSYMRKKGWSFQDDGVVITLAYLLLTYIPLYYAGIVGHPQNQIWAIDKIIAGSTIGATFLFIGHLLNLYLKKLNKGKVYFPYQRVAVPVVILLIISIILWIII